VVANHVSVADPALLAITIPRRTVFMAKKSFSGDLSTPS